MWERLSAFEHEQCTLLACGLPLVKSSLPCSLSLSSPFALRSSCVLFLSYLFSSFPLYSVLPLYVGLHVLTVFFYTLLSVTLVLSLQWRMFEHIHSQPAGMWLHMAAGTCTPGLSCSECDTRCLNLPLPMLMRQSKSQPGCAICLWLSMITPTVALSSLRFLGYCASQYY